jgi:flagellar protein FliS
MAMNAASAYKDSKILTASPAELTLLLYEGAIKFGNLAIYAIEGKDYPGANRNIIKAENIISELRATLNHDYPVAKSFEQVYELIYNRLIQANIKKDVGILEEAIGYIREMRDSWKEVMRLTKGNK